MAKSKFNKLVKQLLEENNVAGGAMSVFGDVAAASPHADMPYAIKYADGDSRIPKPIFKKIIRRNPPELTVFATGVIKNKGKKRGKQIKSKR